MTAKYKNDDIIARFEDSLSARIQRRLKMVKSEQFHLRASPQECMDWVNAFPDSPPEKYLRVLVETQTTKRPFQFSVRIVGKPEEFGARRIDKGTFIGDVTEHPTDENRSVVSLRHYPGMDRLITVLMGVSLLIVIAGVGGVIVSDMRSPQGFDAISSCLQCFGCFFVLAGIGTPLAVLSLGILGRKTSTLVQQYLRKQEAKPRNSIHPMKADTKPSS